MANRYSRPPALFAEYDIYSTFENVAKQAEKEISELDRRYIIETPQEDLARVFEDRRIPEPLTVDFENISFEEDQVEVDVSEDVHRMILDRSRPFYVSVPQLTFIIPFQGQKTVFSNFVVAISPRFLMGTLVVKNFVFHALRG